MNTRLLPRQQRSAESIAKILGAAEWLIARDGQAGFTSAELAAQARMSIGRVYYWYLDLDVVLDAVVDRQIDDLTAMSQPTTPDDAATLLQLLIRQHPAIIVLAVSGPPEGRRARLIDALDTALHQVLGRHPHALAALLGVLVNHHRLTAAQQRTERAQLVTVIETLQHLL